MYTVICIIFLTLCPLSTNQYEYALPGNVRFVSGQMSSLSNLEKHALASKPVSQNLNFEGQKPIIKYDPINNGNSEKAYYDVATQSFYVPCHDTAVLPNVNDAYESMSRNDNGCPVFIKNSFQNVVINFHNRTNDQSLPHVVGSSEQIDHTCNIEEPVWRGVYTIPGMTGYSDGDIVIPNLSNEGTQYTICGISFVLSGLKLTGDCTISFKDPTTVELCSQERQLDVGYFVREYSAHSTHSYHWLTSIQSRFLTNWTSLNPMSKNTKKVTPSLVRSKLTPMSCETIKISNNQNSWKLSAYIRCGSNSYDYVRSFDLESKCHAKYGLGSLYKFCNNYVYFRWVILSISLAYILTSKMGRFISKSSILLPLYIINKPLSLVLETIPLKCQYCRMFLINPLHQCDGLCECGFETQHKGSLIEHNCPLKKKHIENTEKEYEGFIKHDNADNDSKPDFTMKSHRDELARLRAQLLAVKEGIPEEPVYNPTVEYHSNNKGSRFRKRFSCILATPTNRWLTRLSFNLICMTILCFLVPSTIAGPVMTVSESDKIICERQAISIHINDRLMVSAYPRTAVYDPNACVDVPSKVRFLVGNCLLSQRFLCNAYKVNDTMCSQFKKQQLINLADKMLAITTVDVIIKLYESGPSVNTLPIENYCNKYMTILHSEESFREVMNLINTYVDIPPTIYNNNNPIIQEDNSTKDTDESFDPIPALIEYFYFSKDFKGSTDPVIKQISMSKILSEYFALPTNNLITRYKEVNTDGMDTFKKELYSVFNEEGLIDESMSLTPLYIEAKQKDNFVLSFEMDLIAGESAQMQLASDGQPQPIAMKVSVTRSSHSYPFLYQYSTSPTSADTVYSDYRCVETCTSCFESLKSVISDFNYTHAKCWADINNWGCEGKGCWTINTGSLCAYCETKPAPEITDVIKIGIAQPKTRICISFNGHTGCRSFNSSTTITKRFGQIKVSLSNLDNIYPHNTLLAIERSTGLVKEGNILSLGANGDMFGTPQYDSNRNLLHEDPDASFSWQCYNQDKFDVQINSCVKHTYDKIKTLSDTHLVSKIDFLELEHTHVGQVKFNLKVPKNLYTWVEDIAAVSVIIKHVSGCVNCDVKSTMMLSYSSNKNGYLFIDCINFIPEFNILKVISGKGIHENVTGYPLTQNETVSCNFYANNMKLLSNSSLLLKKEHILSGIQSLHPYDKEKEYKRVHIASAYNIPVPNIFHNSWIFNIFYHFKAILITVLCFFVISLFWPCISMIKMIKIPRINFKMPSKKL